MEWVLIVFVYAGIMANTDSVALTNVPGFKSEAACKAAGDITHSLDDGTTKNVVYVCVEVK
jgi:hypothetical protein